MFREIFLSTVTVSLINTWILLKCFETMHCNKHNTNRLDLISSHQFAVILLYLIMGRIDSLMDSYMVSYFKSTSFSVR